MTSLLALPCGPPCLPNVTVAATAVWLSTLGEQLAAIVHRALMAATFALLVAVSPGPLVSVPHVR